MTQLPFLPTAITPFTGNELFYIVQNGGDYSVTWSALVHQLLTPLGYVSSFNTRTGAVTLLSADVTAALGYTPVQTVAGRTGNVTLTHNDLTDWATATAGFATTSGVAATYAPLASPALTGTPTAPTAAPGTNTTQLATTSFVVTSYAPLASPALTGTPTAPTASPGTNSTVIATTAFVVASFAPLNSPTFTGTPAAPTAAAGTSTTQLATTSFVQSAIPHDVGRNVLHNGLFNIAQRGAGPFTTGVYCLDRWLIGLATDTVSFTQANISDASRAQIGDEEAAFSLQNVFTGNAAAGAFDAIIQRIENVRRLAGKTVTVSFWAAAASGTPKLGINIQQIFGTGGSPSASVQALATGAAATLSTTWTRYQTTIAIPSASGKTLGTNGDSSTALQIWYSSGSTNNQIAGNIGVQAATINLWGMQVEVGSAATPLEKPDPRYDLANCQRFYQASVANLTNYGYGGAGNGVIATYLLPVRMRATPSLVNYNFVTASNINTNTVGTLGADSIYMQFTVTALGGYTAAAGWNATADL